MFNFEEEKKKFRFKYKIDIRWSDMDEMHHVNNAIYLTYLEQTRVFYFGDALQVNWEEFSIILANVNINYIQPVRFPNESYVYARVSKFGNKSFEMCYFVTSIVNGKEELCASAVTTLVAFDYRTNQSIAVPESVKEKVRNYESEKI